MRMLDASILGNQVEKRNLQVEKKWEKKEKNGQNKHIWSTEYKKKILLGCFII